MKNTLLLALFSFSATLCFAQQKASTSSVMAAGKKVYAEQCMKCHQEDGAGAMNMIPPLTKTEYVLGNKTRLIKTVLNGMSGELKVNGDMYSGEMPAQDFLKDDEIAAVLTYVRNSFKNKASAVTTQEVKKARASNKK